MKRLRYKAATIEIIAGPNGSGKTTLAESLILTQRSSPVFINPDLIAMGISPLNIEKAAFQAGRVMVQSIKERITHRHSFAFESTLAGRTWVRLLKDAAKKHYEITIYFIFLNNIRDNLARIKTRVKLGGHDIPVNIVRRRYPRSYHNFWKLYRPLATGWYIFNNSGPQPKMVLSKTDYDKMKPDERNSFATSFLKRGGVR